VKAQAKLAPNLYYWCNSCQDSHVKSTFSLFLLESKSAFVIGLIEHRKELLEQVSRLKESQIMLLLSSNHISQLLSSLD